MAYEAVCDWCGELVATCSSEDNARIEVARHKWPHDGVACQSNPGDKDPRPRPQFTSRSMMGVA